MFAKCNVEKIINYVSHENWWNKKIKRTCESASREILFRIYCYCTYQFGMNKITQIWIFFCHAPKFRDSIEFILISDLSFSHFHLWSLNSKSLSKPLNSIEIKNLISLKSELRTPIQKARNPSRWRPKSSIVEKPVIPSRSISHPPSICQWWVFHAETLPFISDFMCITWTLLFQS